MWPVACWRDLHQVGLGLEGHYRIQFRGSGFERGLRAPGLGMKIQDARLELARFVATADSLPT